MTRSPSAEIVQRGLELIQRLLANPDDFSGRDSNDLLSCFYRGLPVEHLRALLEHRHERVLATALFIADEQGKRASAVVPSLVQLLRHDYPKIRSAAYRALGVCIPDSAASDVVHIVRGLLDSDVSCRKMAAINMSREPLSYLSAAASSLHSHEQALRDGMDWLLGASARETETVRSWLMDPDELKQRFGLVAAGRLGASDLRTLEFAEQMGAPEIRQFASVILKWEEIRRKHERRRAERKRS